MQCQRGKIYCSAYGQRDVGTFFGASALCTKGAAHPTHNHRCWCKSELTLMKPLRQTLNKCKSSEVPHSNGSTGPNKGWGKWLQLELDLRVLKEKPHWGRQFLSVSLFSLYPSNLKYSNLFQSIQFWVYFFKTQVNHSFGCDSLLSS